MQAKAHFAQYLIADAWQQTLADEGQHKPWPWADTHPIAKLTFVSQVGVELGSSMRPNEVSQAEWIDEALYVLAGASGRNLAFGPALVMSGSMPSQLGNTIIAGHRDTHFAILNGIKRGQMIHLTDAKGHGKLYRVTQTQIRHHSQNGAMAPTTDDRLTLITCYPFNDTRGGAELRFVVTAELVL